MEHWISNKTHRSSILIFTVLIPILLIQCKTTSKTDFKITDQVQELDWPIEIVSEGHGFTEGPTLAADGKIYFTDMDNSYILEYDPKLDTTNVWHDQSKSANGLRIQNNQLYACEAVGGAVVKYNLSHGPKSKKLLANIFMEDSLGSPNDIAIIGNNLYFSEFWLGTYLEGTGRKQEIFNSRVYKLSLTNNALDSIPFNFELVNGVALSPDGKYLFLTDWLSDKLYKVEIEGDDLGEMELLTDLKKYDYGGPDGLAVNNDGFIFLALYGKRDVLLVINPDGSIVGYLPTGPLTSNCVFAADGNTLYITANKKLMRVKVPKMKK